MFKVQLKQLLDRFNASYFIFYCCLLVLGVLVGLRADLVLSWSYGLIFLPLWFWNVALIAGLVGGTISRCYCKELNMRSEEEHEYDFKALCVSAGLQSLLLVTELLTAINIDLRIMPWSAVFTPVYLLTLLSIPACIWGCFRKRRIDLELLIMCTVLQFIFLGIKLDNLVQWSWGVTFIPIWLLLVVFVVGELVYLVVVLLSYMLADNQQSIEERKLPDLLFFICATVFTISLIIFLALLASRLDEVITIPYSALLVFFHFSTLSLLVSTLTRQPANPWWFGVRKNTSDFVLQHMPLLQELANVSFTKMREDDVGQESEEQTMTVSVKGLWWRKRKAESPEEPVQLLEDIYSPD